ncbi:hypothetical protein NPIL_66111 [Nephila pilipes]|uniref:Uncharacterized protein n=1 Tax=Nephila pilipes TaxID=299642 RepID=A0A8X6MV65_NEPPI|nr:hypothetical protein NPIL_66111 [Nephila pilipes]
MASSMCVSSNLCRLLCIAVYLLVSMYCVKSSGVISTVSSHLKSSKDILCTDVRYAYTAKGFSNSDVPFQAISVRIQSHGGRYWEISDDLVGWGNAMPARLESAVWVRSSPHPLWRSMLRRYLMRVEEEIS